MKYSNIHPISKVKISDQYKLKRKVKIILKDNKLRIKKVFLIFSKTFHYLTLHRNKASIVKINLEIKVKFIKCIHRVKVKNLPKRTTLSSAQKYLKNLKLRR